MTTTKAPNGTGIKRIRLMWSLFLKERTEPEPFYEALGAETAFDLEQRYGIQGHRILDIGCGPGWYTEAMRKYGATVLGIDGDLGVLTRAQPPIPGLTLGDATLMSFPDNSFDGVFCSNMLEHTSSPAMVVNEIIRVLKPGGWGYLSWTNWYSPNGGHNMNPYQYLGPKWGPMLYEKRHGPPPDNRYGEGLFAVHIGPTLRMIRQQPDISITRIEPRYWPWARFIIHIPGLREFFTWNCVIRFTRKN